MTLVPSARPQRTRWLIGIAAVLLAVFAFSASPALLTAANAATTTPVDPATAKQSMQIWVRLDSDKTGVPNVSAPTALVTACSHPACTIMEVRSPR